MLEPRIPIFASNYFYQRSGQHASIYEEPKYLPVVSNRQHLMLGHLAATRPFRVGISAELRVPSGVGLRVPTEWS